MTFSILCKILTLHLYYVPVFLGSATLLGSPSILVTSSNISPDGNVTKKQGHLYVGFENTCDPL